MKKMLILIVMIGFLISLTPVVASEVYNTSSGYVFTGTAYLKTDLINQDPYPAEPGAYVDMVFKVENMGTESLPNVTVNLMPEYPFSLDPGASTMTSLGTMSGLQYGNNAFLVKYKVKVDKDAVNGDSQIKFAYSYGSSSSYFTQTYDVKIANPKTDFDVVAQDSSGTSTTLAIANIGSNTAYSTVVRIPDQQNFMTTGTSANIIGNLNAGDYTLVSFQITSARNLANMSMPWNGTRVSQSGNFTNLDINGKRDLLVDIVYTDTLGIRRTVEKNVTLNMMNATSMRNARAQTSTGNFSLTSLTSGGNGLLYVVIGVIGIVAIALFFKLRKFRKVKK